MAGAACCAVARVHGLLLVLALLQVLAVLLLPCCCCSTSYNPASSCWRQLGTCCGCCSCCASCHCSWYDTNNDCGINRPC